MNPQKEKKRKKRNSNGKTDANLIKKKQQKTAVIKEKIGKGYKFVKKKQVSLTNKPCLIESQSSSIWKMSFFLASLSVKATLTPFLPLSTIDKPVFLSSKRSAR